MVMGHAHSSSSRMSGLFRDHFVQRSLYFLPVVRTAAEVKRGGYGEVVVGCRPSHTCKQTLLSPGLPPLHLPGITSDFAQGRGLAGSFG